MPLRPAADRLTPAVLPSESAAPANLSPSATPSNSSTKTPPLWKNRNIWEKTLFPRQASKLSFLPHSPRTNQGSPKPLRLELYPSSSDELVNDAILGAALRGTPSRLPIR